MSSRAAPRTLFEPFTVTPGMRLAPLYQPGETKTRASFLCWCTVVRVIREWDIAVIALDVDRGTDRKHPIRLGMIERCETGWRPPGSARVIRDTDGKYRVTRDGVDQLPAADG